MITKNPMQLKAFIKNKAAEKHISAQLVMQNYMLERLLERISLSPYKNNFILKGGFLISAIVGLDTRATMDLDTTIKGFTLTHEAIRKIFTDICTVQIADDVQFAVVGISDIRETDDYPGIRVGLKANYPPISVPLTVDVTTGDMITPVRWNTHFPCCLMIARSVFLPTILKRCWRKSWKRCYPATLQIPVREIITTYISCMRCAVKSVIKKHYARLWNGQQKSAAAERFLRTTWKS